MREQLVDLLALGFSAAYLDAAQPAVRLSERFGRVPPGLATDAYFLYVQLLDAGRRPIASWGRDGPDSHWSFAGAPPFQCTTSCTLLHNESAWQAQQYTFTGYGANLRYVLWRDGGPAG